MIGSLMYLTSSRPDIMFAVCACDRYQVNLKVSHLHAVKKFFRKPKRKNTQVPQPSGPTDNVVDEVVYKKLDDSLVRAASTASSLDVEQDSSNITKTQSKATPNEPSFQGTDSGGGPRVLDLEKTKTTQRNEIDSLKRRVKKLEKRNKSRTHKLKRLYKGRRIDAIDADEDITLVSDDDNEMFDVDDLGGDEVFVTRKNENVVKEIVDAAQVSTAATTVTITTKEITLPQALEALKTSKLKDDIEAKINADHQLAKRLKAQEQEQLSDAKKATLFQQILEKRRKHFAAKKGEEKRNKPPTQAQKRKIMCTYLKNIERYTLKQLKLKEFDKIQEMFDRSFKRVNTFEDFGTKLVERKEKRAGEELEQEITKKQKVEDDKEKEELKQLMELFHMKKK
uniref:Putative ribonuclease H-like domain-containing protein n=1 Tax=Tanacetum cinerariifolium TaxID=118510 RepID=A0A6L2L9A3_TANCI|nr:putative ribonuclease H-like domain-containing protein [Tanacetum cinerariifolium]